MLTGFFFSLVRDANGVSLLGVRERTSLNVEKLSTT